MPVNQTHRCQFIEACGVHGVACGGPGVALLWWPSRLKVNRWGQRERAAPADTVCCHRHAQEATRDAPRARRVWLTTRVWKHGMWWYP